MKREEGCIGFTPIADFAGTFDGQGYEIRNIYENNSGYIGLIASSYYNTSKLKIKNIGITGYMETSTDTYAGEIISYILNNSEGCINCYYKVTIVANSASMVCGIVGRGGKNIENCYNVGTISGTSVEGGIVGSATSSNVYIINGEILNCFYLNTVSGGYDYEMVTRETTSLSENEMYSQSLVDKLNLYITENGYEDEFNYWILGEDGYPTFE